MSINKVKSMIENQYNYKYEGEFEGVSLWTFIEDGGLSFTKKERYFKKNSPDKFSKVATILNSNKMCEIDFLKKIQELIKANQFSKPVYFIVQPTHDKLRSKITGRNLVVDLEVCVKLADKLKPIIAIEINENNHNNYISNQDGLKDYYSKKNQFFIKNEIGFLEITYEKDYKNNNVHTSYKIEDLQKLISQKLQMLALDMKN